MIRPLAIAALLLAGCVETVPFRPPGPPSPRLPISGVYRPPPALAYEPPPVAYYAPPPAYYPPPVAWQAPPPPPAWGCAPHGWGHVSCYPLAQQW